MYEYNINDIISEEDDLPSLQIHICMRISRNVTKFEAVMKERSHWTFAMYKVIGLPIFMSLIVPVYPMCKL